MNKKMLRALGAIALGLLPALALANIQLDRTRLIYEEQDKNVSMVLSNTSPGRPYLVQTWLSDDAGRRLSSPFLVLPPLQRIEAGEKGVIRLARLPDAALPVDREAVFYLNVQEIPPKSEQDNVLQIAIKSRIKVFYRPKGAQLAHGVSPLSRVKLSYDAAGGELTLENASPYHITLTGWKLPGDKKARDLDGRMLAPQGTLRLPLATLPQRLELSHINDYGAEETQAFRCAGSACEWQEGKR